MSLSSVFREGVVWITVEPALVKLGGCNHGMSARTCVFARVLVRGIVAAQRRAALLTGAQMHPSRADPHALSALAPLGMFHSRNRGKMAAGSVRHQLTPLSKTHGRTDRHRPHNAQAARSAPRSASGMQSYLNPALPCRNLPARKTSTTFRAEVCEEASTPCHARAGRRRTRAMPGR